MDLYRLLIYGTSHYVNHRHFSIRGPEHGSSRDHTYGLLVSDKLTRSKGRTLTGPLVQLIVEFDLSST